MSVEKPEEEKIIDEDNKDTDKDKDKKKKEEGGEGKIPTPLEKSKEDSEWWREQE